MKHTKPKQFRVLKNRNGEPLVEQGIVHGFNMSWNPDDNRFYIEDTDEDRTPLATRKDWRNATLIAKKMRAERNKKA